jgi:hypothetical protein
VMAAVGLVFSPLLMILIGAWFQRRSTGRRVPRERVGSANQTAVSLA